MRSEPRSLQYHDVAGAMPQPAGKVLIIGVIALFIAALLNVDGLSDLANRQDVGWKRDASRAVIEPFCAVSDLTRLRAIRSSIRDAADKRRQDCQKEASGSESFVAPSTTTTEVAGPPFATRVPTAADPLRVWLGGDSMTIELAQSTSESVTARREIDLATHPEVSSGLTRPDYFDWPAYLRDEVLPTGPEVLVVMFGANDSQGMEIDGAPYQPESAEWQNEYRRRVGVVMDMLNGDGRLTVWVIQPHMRDASFDARMEVLAEIFATEAESRPWVRTLDARTVLSPAGGGYQASHAGTSLRQGDGIHLDRGGADLLADAVLALIQDTVIQG